MKPGAPILHDHIKFHDKPSNIAGTLEHKKGDVEAGFKEADVIVERSFKTEAVHQGYIEPHACLVSVTDGKATIWSSSQGQFMVRAMSALLTGMAQSDIRAIPAEIGGGFGGKTIIYLEPLALVLAEKSGKPVKMVMSREEVFRASGPTSGSMSKVKIGAKKDGTIVAAQGTYYLQAGAFPGSPIRGAAGCAFGPYDIANVHTVGYDVVSNRSKVAAYRAPGAPIGAYRRRVRARRAGREAQDGSARAAPEERRQAGHQGGARSGLSGHGLRGDGEAGACHPHYKAPLKPNQGRGVGERLLVQRRRRIERAGQHHRGRQRSLVMTGHPDIGGSRASTANIAAELLGIDHSRVNVLIGDTSSDRLLEPDRRQPRHLRVGDGGHAVGRDRHQAALRARGQDLEDRPGRRHLGQRLRQAGRRQRRQVRAAVARRRSRPRRPRPAARSAPAPSSTRPAPRAASPPTSATSRSTADTGCVRVIR